MRIEFSVATGDGHRDVAVSAPGPTPLADLAPSVARAVGLTGGPAFWTGPHAWAGHRLDDGALRPGAVVTTTPPPGRGSGPGVLTLRVIGGPAAGRAIPLARGRVTIGRDESCDLVLADPDVSRWHAELDVGARLLLRDCASTNGTTVDDARVGAHPVAVHPGCLIRMGDSLLTVAAPAETPAVLLEGDDGTRHVLRPPRVEQPPSTEEISLPTRTAHGPLRGVQWISALLPALAGVALAWLVHSPQFLLFALVSPLMLVSTAVGDRLHWRRARRRDAASFRRRRLAAERQVADALLKETAARRWADPDPAAVERIAALPASRLWSRRPTDADFLALRIGTGELPAGVRVREGASTRPAGLLRAVPVTVELCRGAVGLAGPRHAIDPLARWLIGQLAVQHSPGELELALLLTAERQPAWTWARWLPHLRGRVAATARRWSSLLADLEALVDQRQAALRGGQWAGPWLVLLVDRAAPIGELPALGAVLERGPAVGISAICVERHASALPAGCATVAEVTGETGTRLRVGTPAGVVTAVADAAAPAWAEQVARHLASLVDAGDAGGGSLPPHCALLETLELPTPAPGDIAARWASSDGGARITLGRGVDGPLTIDLARDGPHALIAGTTGAGKSELLQTLVASLAANHPPDEVNVLLVDYKGGAAFAGCSRLPHTAGLVTDLDAYLTERALRTLGSELRRRERLLAARGAADLEAYRAGRPAEPIPRLVIVVDEFAALVEELPDFVRGLIGVAQRGRSLGVHLVLATQRPGRAVSPEIRANTALRIALRVTDPGESTDVIDAPDAALLDRAAPGRGYLRTGPALICFQAAHAGAVTPAARESVTVECLGTWRRPARPVDPGGPTDLERLVEAVAAAARQTARPAARSPWLPPLPNELRQAELTPAPSPFVLRFARIDQPDEQRHAELDLDLQRGGSVLISGTRGSGRTEALATLALTAADQLPPAELALYVLDAAGQLAELLRPLPHSATVLGPAELALAPRLLALLTPSRNGPVDGSDRPAGLLLIDDWDRLLSALGEVDAAACADSLPQVLRAGPAAALSVALTGDRSTLAPRFSAPFGTKVLLRPADRSDVGLVGLNARHLPVELPPGRGLRAEDGAVLQVAHVGARPGLEHAGEVGRRVAERWHSLPMHTTARITLRPLPEHVRLDELPRTGTRLPVGLAGDQLDCLAVDPFAGAGRMLVAGPPRSGRSTALCALLRQADEAGIRTVVAAPARSPLADAARRLRLPVFGPDDADDADPGPVPSTRTLLLVDDCEAFTDSRAGDRLTSWLRTSAAPLAAVVAGRAEELATSYRGVGAEVRRNQCGILLRPGPVDGELLGVRLPRRASAGPPGRGVAVGDPAWGPLFRSGEPVPVQLATP